MPVTSIANHASISLPPTNVLRDKLESVLLNLLMNISPAPLYDVSYDPATIGNVLNSVYPAIKTLLLVSRPIVTREYVNHSVPVPPRYVLSSNPVSALFK